MSVLHFQKMMIVGKISLISKDIITVLGGVYAMANPERAMKDKNLDYVVIGEGEYVFKQLLGFHSGACDLPKRGICFRKKGTNELDNRGHAEFIKNLDLLPKPAYHLIDFLSYYEKFNNRKTGNKKYHFCVDFCAESNGII